MGFIRIALSPAHLPIPPCFQVNDWLPAALPEQSEWSAGHF